MELSRLITLTESTTIPPPVVAGHQNEDKLKHQARYSVGKVPWMKRESPVSHSPLSWLLSSRLSCCRDVKHLRDIGIGPTEQKAPTADKQTQLRFHQLRHLHTHLPGQSRRIFVAGRMGRIGGPGTTRQTTRQNPRSLSQVLGPNTRRESSFASK